MISISKGILRFGLIAALAVGGATLLVGRERVAATFGHLRHKAQVAIDGAVDSPEALRRNLQRLAGEYPERIALVRTELAEVDRHLRSFQEDIERADRVVAIASGDLDRLGGLVERAKAEREQASRPVVIRFDGVRLDIEQAYAEGRRIASIRDGFRDRLEQDRFQVTFLTEQRARLTEILDTLEREYDSYQAQLWQLDRQIDAVQRNDRLIALTEAQQATLDGFEKLGKVQNLRQVEAKLAQMRTEQEARLQQLSRRQFRKGYEDRAEMDLGLAQRRDPFIDSIEVTPIPGPNVAEIVIAEEPATVLAESNRQN
ncbi:MAG: hypothetical protein KF817_08035 [Phycisphaeraceae bacterium]|nr:hypothetical protein [Phycisphaeraceae bacterium]